MVIALVLVVAAFLIFFDLTQPTYRDIQAIKGQAMGREEFIESKKVAIRQVQKLIQSFTDDLELQNAQAAVGLSFPTEPDLPSALIQLNGLIELNNLSVRSIAVSESTPTGKNTSDNRSASSSSSFVRPISKVIFNLELTGTYEDLKNLLRNIESNIRIFYIEQIGISPQIKPGQNVYQYSLKVVTYYQGQPK